MIEHTRTEKEEINNDRDKRTKRKRLFDIYKNDLIKIVYDNSAISLKENRKAERKVNRLLSEKERK